MNETIDMATVSGMGALAATERAVSTAEEQFLIPRVMDPEDLVHSPEEHSIMTCRWRVLLSRSFVFSALSARESHDQYATPSLQMSPSSATT
jgi:hypothetical protein